jgi:hypothetical protein
MMKAVKLTGLPGERMSDEEMLAEIDSSRRWMVIVGVAIVATTVIATLLYFLFRSSGGGAPAQ